MKCRLALPLSLLLMLLAVAVCTGSRLFYMLAILLLLLLIMGLTGVLWAAGTLSVSVRISEDTVRRGEDVTLLFSLCHRGRVPVAPVKLELASAVAETREIHLKNAPGRIQRLQLPVHTAHVGVFPSGIRACEVSDLLSIFSRRVAMRESLFELTVLPNTFETRPLTLSPGDPGSEIMAQATEDTSAPSDVRSYQAGDAMKKIHWKLSVKKGELMVRRFEEPVLQDVLILMDCSRPPSWGHPQAEADLRDLLLETSASLFAAESRTDHSVRMPLLGDHPVDVDGSMGIPIAFQYLARVDFSETDRFERVLMIESRRLRKVGCVVIVSARLNSAMVDLMIRMRRMGPAIRLYLITFAPEDANVQPLLSRLETATVDVETLSPRSV